MIIDNKNYSLKGYQVKELVEKVKESNTVFQTIFYMNASETGATRHIYKKSDMTDPATSKDVFDANDKGQVILRISTSATPDMYSDAYLQNAYSATGDYQLLFLDEKTYRSFDTTNLTDSTFTYSSRVIQDKIIAGTNIQINGATISATDTTYSDFTGTDGTQTGVAGLVPAPVAADAGKFLKADGTWGVAGGSGPTVVQTTGTSTTDVMSQSATTSMVYADPATKLQVQVGDSANGASTYAVAIGANSKASNHCVAIGGSSSLATEKTRAIGDNCVALGAGAQADNSYSTAVGGGARAGEQYSLALGYGATSPATYSHAIALGAGARTAHAGEMNIGTGAGSGNGYNSSDYRLISGVYDPQNAHDAATKGYVDSVAPVITMTSTDPGEGVALAENHFIAVY